MEDKKFFIKNNLHLVLKSCENIIKYGREPLKNLGKIKQEINKIEKELSQGMLGKESKQGILESFVSLVKTKISDWQEEIKKNFGRELEEKLKQKGFELRGHYPLLKVSFYTLEVDFNNFKTIIWYGPKQEKLETCELNAEEVVNKLKIIHDKITQREFNEKEFLLKVYEAYKISTLRQNKKLGEEIPILDVLFDYVFLIQDKKFKTNPIKKNYKEYGRCFFSYDLYRLKEREIDNKKLSLITATRAYTRQKSGYLWIPSNERGEGACISHLKFKEVKDV